MIIFIKDLRLNVKRAEVFRYLRICPRGGLHLATRPAGPPLFNLEDVQGFPLAVVSATLELPFSHGLLSLSR
jgi:hypothetical protein